MSVYLQQWEKEGLNLHFGAQFAVVFEVSLSCPELYGIVVFFSVRFSLMELRRLEIFAKNKVYPPWFEDFGFSPIF